MTDYRFYLMRHGIKAYENGRGIPAFDPPLITEPTVNDNYLKVASEILREVGIRQIISSPFLRCRQTAEFVARHLKLFRPIHYSLSFREYLGNWRKESRRNQFRTNEYYDSRTKEILDESMQKKGNYTSYKTNPIKIFERDFESFKCTRIQRISEEIRRTKYIYNKECIITHTVVIEILLQFLGCPIDKKYITPGSVIEVIYRGGDRFESKIITPPMEFNIEEAFMVKPKTSPVIGSLTSVETVDLSSEELSTSFDDSDDEILAEISKINLDDL